MVRMLWGFRRFDLVLVGPFINKVESIERRRLATIGQFLVLIIKIVELIARSLASSI